MLSTSRIKNIELRFCFSLLVIVKVAATFTSVFEARGSRLSETFRGPKAKKQPLWDLEATLQPRELVPEDGLQSVEVAVLWTFEAVVVAVIEK